MISIVLMIQNIRELQILTMAFEQQGVKVLAAEPTYQSYVLVLQYMPDIIIVELPHLCIEQLSFTKRIRTYKRTRLIPIVGYGNVVPQAQLRGMTANGITAYIQRPLKFTELLQQAERLLKPFNKTIGKKEVASEKEKDVAAILDAATVPSQKIEAMCRHIAKLVAFPFTIAKVLKLSNDEKAGAGELAKAITADPAISTHLLKVANSVFFASANRRIGSIKEAIVRIGFSETKRIVMGMSVMNLFSQSNKNFGFDRTDFWYHSLAAALIAERVARSFGELSVEEAFLAGLLHDLGIMFIDEYFPQVFSDVLSRTAQQAGHFYDQELAYLNVSHLDLIADLFPKWKIPQQITNAITGQYAVLGFKRPPETADEKLSLCVMIGNMVAKMLHLGRECDEFVQPIDNQLLEAAKLPAGITAGFIENITTQVITYRSFLGLEARDYSSNCPEGFDPKKVRIAVCNIDRSIVVPPMIDLQNNGIKCDVIRSDVPASEYNGKFNGVIYWSVSAIDPVLLKSYNALSPPPLHADDTPDPDKKIPVFLFCPQDSESEHYSECKVMKNSFDLRLFEATFGSELERQGAAIEKSAAGGGV